MIDERKMNFLKIARACARVRGMSKLKLNDIDISVVCEVANAEPHGLAVSDICDLVSERDKTWVFRSIQRMQESGVLEKRARYNPETKRSISAYVLGAEAESQITFWADIFDSTANL